MKKQVLGGPGDISAENRNLSKSEYLRRLASVREKYLEKLLNKFGKEDIPYICRIERVRFRLLLALDSVTENEFQKPQEEVPSCIGCINSATCKEKYVCINWSLADFLGHLLTHEEKELGPDWLEPLKHMTEHEEIHLRQIESIVQRFGDMKN